MRNAYKKYEERDSNEKERVGEFLFYWVFCQSSKEFVVPLKKFLRTKPEIDYHMPKKKGITKSLGVARSFLSSEIPPFSLHFSDVFEC